MSIYFNTLVTDGLNGANQNPLAGLWQTTSGQSQLQILGNQCVVVDGISFTGAVNLVSDLPTNNRWAEVKISTFATPMAATDTSIDLAVYSSTDLVTNYLELSIYGGIFDLGFPSISLNQSVGTVVTTLFDIAYNPVVGDVWRLATNSNNYYVYKNGVLFQSGTFDTSVIAGAPHTIIVLTDNDALGQVGVTNFAGGITGLSPFIGNPTAFVDGVGTFFGQSFAQAFSNPSSMDVLQVVDRGGAVVWNLSSTGIANPGSATKGALFTYFGSSFLDAFPNVGSNNFDVLQVVNAGDKVIFSVDYQGNAGSH